MSKHVGLQPGTGLGDNARYVVRCCIGRGGFSVTYLAADTVHGGTVAVKEFYPADLSERKENIVSPIHGKEELFAAAEEAFSKEYSLLKELNDTAVAGIPTVRDRFESNGTVYIVENYIEGPSLSDYVLVRGGKLDWANTASVLRPIAELVKTLHNKGIVHKDISPSNIILANNENAFLIDFGSVFMPIQTLKHGYAPVEAYTEGSADSPAFDIYSLAATAYRCLTGVVLPRATDRAASSALPSPSALGADIPPEAEKILMQALAVNAEDRIKTDDELIQMFSATTAQADQKAAVVDKPAEVPPVSVQPDNGDRTVILAAEQASQQTEGVTVILDCAQKIQGDSYAATPADAAKKFAGRFRNYIHEHPAVIKKAAAGAAIAVIAIAAGTYGYKGIYLNSSGKLLARAEESLRANNISEAYQLAKHSADKGNKAAEVFILELALDRGTQYTPDYNIKEVITKSMEYAEDNNNYFVQVLLCYNWARGTGSNSYSMYREMVPFEKIRKYTDAVIESTDNLEISAADHILDRIYDSVAAVILNEAQEKRDLNMVPEGINYYRLITTVSPVRADELEKQYTAKVQALIDRDKRAKEEQERKLKQKQEQERRRQEEAKRKEQQRLERERKRQEEEKRKEQLRQEREKKRQEEAKRQEQRRQERKQRQDEAAKRQEQKRQERDAKGSSSKTTQSNTNQSRGGTLSDRVNTIKKGAN